MSRQNVRLSDRLDLSKSPVLVNGTQALVRLMLTQAERDRLRGWHTGGYVTGYRGSPLGGVDRAMQAASALLSDANVTFQPGLNEDLAATAVWGTQTVPLRGEGTVEGVFGLWYGKGPGVDRSGDALRHANLAGTSERGGVLMVAGDDHTGESSTTCHQSDLAMIDAGIPVLSPAGVQEIVDYGLYAFEMSRFSGLWVGMKAVKDTVEATAVIDGQVDRMTFVTPEVTLPGDGLSIRLGDHWVPQEERLVSWKWPAARAFARANGIDGRKLGRAGGKIGLVAAGKSWLDLLAALELLGIGPKEAEALGITAYKVGQIWPLEEEGIREWAEGLDLVIVVEEKRKLIEPQIARALWGRDLRLWGERGPDGPLFPEHGPLDPSMIASKLGRLLLGEGIGEEQVRARLAELNQSELGEDLAARLPWFCAGCPHNTSIRLPEGSRAGGGIGCHTMALWMDRGTEGYTHMGAEGATWIGEAPFSRVPHVFQNIGDGTYNHSGLQAIRAAVAANVNITYKILFNDAVALTGGQSNEGDLSPEQIAAEVLAAGVQRVDVVHDGREGAERRVFPAGVSIHHRDDLEAVQRELRQVPGVSVLIYVQTCAAEKRRRRRRGEFAPIRERVFIDPDVCEGCGDCGEQSNCVAILPLETPMGRKREIDQAACNADLSCLKGFCPSFVTVEGGTLRKAAVQALTIPELPMPAPVEIDGTWSILVTGIGGTGAVTIGAVLAMAAHLEEKGAGVIEMAGLAQKGGAVSIHCRIANSPNDISAIRVSPGRADAIIGGDIVTTATTKTLATAGAGTRAVVNSHEIVTGAFTRSPEFALPGQDLRDKLTATMGERVRLLDATRLAQGLLGDAIFANMLLTGASWQNGLIPIGYDAMLEAIELNGAAVESNLRAFELGRWAAADPDAVEALLKPASGVKDETTEELVARLEAHLAEYQSLRLARRYRAFVERIPDPELRSAVARGYHKLLTYKDEYEVARLLRDAPDKVARVFDGDYKISYNLAPPLLSRPGPDGRPRKRRFGPWLQGAFKLLARLRFLRGTALDPFGYTAERRMERSLIRAYEQDLSEAVPLLRVDTRVDILELAELPLKIKGFGPVKEAAVTRAEERRSALRAQIRNPATGAQLAAE